MSARKLTKLFRICKKCSSLFLAIAYEVRVGKALFCCIKCKQLNPPKTIPVETRYWSGVITGKGCWGWKKSKDINGYGVINVKGKMEKLHRISWLLHFGPIPKGKNVCHHCDNPVCSNPSHLFLGTQKENVYDMIRKGRSSVGQDCTYAKLTARDVLSIREKYATGKYTQNELGNKYHVHRATIGLIITGKNWKSLPLQRLSN